MYLFKFVIVGATVLFGATIVGAQDTLDSSAAATGAETVAAEVQPGGQGIAATQVSERFADLSGKVDGLNESYLETKGTVDKLKKIKISGYVQAQVRAAVNYDDATDTAGSREAFGTYQYYVGDFAGGRLGDRMQSVFQIRRGRIKVAYETDLTQAVVQVDAIPFATANVAGTSLTTVNDTIKDSLGRNHVVTKSVATNATPVLSGGGVSIKDVYLRFADPWLKSIAIKAGVFDRPFGFEIGYSSSNRESPERSRLFQTLYPNERDLGVSLEYLPSDNITGFAQYFNLKGGLFTGNGINNETDSYRDIIGRLGVSLPFNSINMGIDAGVSGYIGKVLSRADSLYEMSGTSFAGTKGHLNEAIDRMYTGGDIQLYYGDIPVIGGLTLRSEFISGRQPGSKSSAGSPRSDISSSSVIYSRNFMGYYGMLVQNLDPIKSQLVLKYDMFDPNVDIEGKDIESSTGLTAAAFAPSEMAYKTLGVGLVYHWDENVKFIAYLDKVMNEEITSPIFDKDVKDDVFTFRIQYKF
jgi:hypothetical protein